MFEGVSRRSEEWGRMRSHFVTAFQRTKEACRNSDYSGANHDEPKFMRI